MTGSRPITPIGNSTIGDGGVRTWTRPGLLADGLTDNDLKRLTRRAELARWRPGLYAHPDASTSHTPVERHRALIRHLVPQLDERAVVSHISAALMWSLPLWNVPLDRIHVTRPVTSGTHRSPGVHVHSERTPAVVSVIDGICVTAPARTVVDTARSMPFAQGVVIADAALHAQMVTREELAHEVARAKGRRGIGRARTVVAFADGRSESVGESRSRIVLARSGLPGLQLQCVIRDARGHFVARTDFGIPELKIAGEFDGKVKYGRLLRPGQEAGDAVFEEKQREDAVRRESWTMVRWVWPEIDTPDVICGRWWRAVRVAQNLPSLRTG